MTIEEWRIPLAKVGLLQTATNVLRDEIPQVSGWEHSRWLELQIQAIRLIGNICADIGRLSS